MQDFAEVEVSQCCLNLCDVLCGVCSYSVQTFLVVFEIADYPPVASCRHYVRHSLDE